MVTEALVEPNVAGAQKLLSLLEGVGLQIRAALWVLNPDVGIWRLWLTPLTPHSDKREFYREIAKTVAEHRTEVCGLDTSDIELIHAEHPALKGLRSFLRIEGFSSVRFSKNMLNGYYLPDAVILRMT